MFLEKTKFISCRRQMCLPRWSQSHERRTQPNLANIEPTAAEMIILITTLFPYAGKRPGFLGKWWRIVLDASLQVKEVVRRTIIPVEIYFTGLFLTGRCCTSFYMWAVSSGWLRPFPRSGMRLLNGIQIRIRSLCPGVPCHPQTRFVKNDRPLYL